MLSANMPIPQRPLRFSQQLPHPAGQVWRAVADRALLSRWFLPTQDLELWVGHAFTFARPDDAPALSGRDALTHCEILEVDPGRTLAFAYRGEGGETVLRFVVETVGADRSCLHLEHGGFRGAKGLLARLLLAPGWKKRMRERLPRLLKQAVEEALA
jgi:uncharacterized protein YndB with AHSA1/START domain